AHDAVLAQVSHLPHIVSFSLINSISPQALAIAPQSLREMTRIAGSDARLWTDIILENRSNAVRRTREFQKNIAIVQRAVARNDRRALITFFERARKRRERIA
ncbi:MAG: prephenate dehydrogenase/arogenate dehydrogenase family protein, partial [Candidatus Omnitrophica bacterium]|nr:prephenate dehydrogenase/arogenate dehydrogenase family protein [Candidatus Omnitrophota bacterium]